MRPRFLGDANFHADIVSGLLRSEPAIDFLTADEAGLRGKDDIVVLRKAAELDRILVTHDHQSMPHHFGTILKKGHCSGVIIIFQSIPIGEAIDGLLHVWAEMEQEEWSDRLAYLSEMQKRF